MPRFKVFVAGNCPVHTEIEVEAANAEKAADHAVRQAETSRYTDWHRSRPGEGYHVWSEPHANANGLVEYVENIYAAGVKSRSKDPQSRRNQMSENPQNPQNSPQTNPKYDIIVEVEGIMNDLRLYTGCAENEIARLYELLEIETITCSVCHRDAPKVTAHLHQGEWIGDICCFDARLHASE